MKLSKVVEDIPLNIYRLDVQAEVKFCVFPEYDITIAVPRDYIILLNSNITIKKSPDSRYKEITQKITKKKYRNLTGSVNLLLYSKKGEVSEKFINVNVKKKTGLVLQDNRFSLSVKNGTIALRKTGIEQEVSHM